MSSEESPSSGDGNSPEEQKKAANAGNGLFPESVHPDLRVLISMANSDGTISSSMGVTVWVKGIQMAGQVASAKAGRLWFFKKLHDAFQTPNIQINGKSPGSEVEGPLKKIIQEVADKDFPALTEAIQDAPPTTRYGFLTLQNARVWGPGGLISLEFVRVNLEQIDAFTLGVPND